MEGTALIKYFSQYPLRIVFLIFTLASMVAIFMFSAEDANVSSDTSGGFTQTAIELLVQDYDELPAEKQQEIWDKADHIIRKTAHFTIYMCLGFWASCTLGRRKLMSVKTAAVLGFCFLYACTDELHQYFVPGRACRFKDVMIDTAGAFTGIVCSMIAIAGVLFAAKKLTAKRKDT